MCKWLYVSLFLFAQLCAIAEIPGQMPHGHLEQVIAHLEYGTGEEPAFAIFDTNSCQALANQLHLLYVSSIVIGNYNYCVLKNEEGNFKLFMRNYVYSPDWGEVGTLIPTELGPEPERGA